MKRILNESISDSSSDEEDKFPRFIKCVEKKPTGRSQPAAKLQKNDGPSQTFQKTSSDRTVETNKFDEEGSLRYSSDKTDCIKSCANTADNCSPVDSILDNTHALNPPSDEVVTFTPSIFNSLELIPECDENGDCSEDDADCTDRPSSSLSNLVPLRQRSSGDMNKMDNRNNRESSDKWRQRLWPNKAILSFIRMLTRCIPPDIRMTQHLKQNGERRRCLLEPHWPSSELSRISTYFESTSDHSAAFFLNIVEESRAYLEVSDYEVDSYVPPNLNFLSAENSWLHGEMRSVKPETEVDTRSSYDPRFGIVWLISASIRIPKNRYYSGEGTLCAGDVMLMRTDRWNRLVIGVVQPWDPDFDLKFGKSDKTMQKVEYLDNGDVLVSVNIFVCIAVATDGSISRSSPGGWAEAGWIMPGIMFSISILGNVMTYIRESQGLMSLRLLRPELHSALLPNAATRRVDYPLPEIAKTNPSEASQSEDFPCPAYVPLALWGALQKDFNASQVKALYSMCERDPATDYLTSPVGLLRGPPGTGKTKVILGAIALALVGAMRLKNREGAVVVPGASLNPSANDTATSNSSDAVDAIGRFRVLVCAPSNIAVDEIVYRLLTQGVLDRNGKRREDLRVVRIGRKDGFKDPRSLRMRNLVFKQYQKNENDEDIEEDRSFSDIIEKANLEYLVEEKKRALIASMGVSSIGLDKWRAGDLSRQALEDADIVCCTLSGAGSAPVIELLLRMPNFKFDVVIIDEAAQASEPSSLIPFKFNPSFAMLVGDPAQLQSLVFSTACARNGYARSLFERLRDARHIPVYQLTVQYRMHPAIVNHSSRRFYRDTLVTEESLIRQLAFDKPFHNHPSGRMIPFAFHDLKYGRMYRAQYSCSYYNDDEIRYVCALFGELIYKYPESRFNIGIIVPYRAQKERMCQRLVERFGQRCKNLDTEVVTIDGFQGREKDIIIFSCVRAAGSERGIGFLGDKRRLNVAITRAKYGLWIVGHARTLSGHPEWRSLIDHARRSDAYIPLSDERSAVNFNNTNNSRHDYRYRGERENNYY